MESDNLEQKDGEQKPLVLVTGASGFVGSHIVKMLLAEGYPVRGTVRDPKNVEKVGFLEQLPGAKERLELVHADLLQPTTWAPAVQGCKYVLHVASPFVIADPDDENVLIKPAVEGTLSVLTAVAAHNGTNPTVRIDRVVVTSSIVAIANGWDDDKSKTDHTWAESDWSNVDKCKAYAKSKTLAEKAAWEFVAKFDKDCMTPEQAFELATVNPTLVQGPLLTKRGGEASAKMISRLMKNDMPGIPKLSVPMVDVRDVAQMHLRAMTNPEAAGKRFLCYSGEARWMSQVAKLLSDEFKPQGYKIPTMGVPKFVISIVSLWDKAVKSIASSIGKETRYDNTRAKQVLGMTFIAPDKSIIDMAYSLIEVGLVEQKKAKLAAKEHKQRRISEALE